MRPIDAEKLIEKLSTGLDNPEEFPVISLGTILRMIDNEPEVVVQPELDSETLIRTIEMGITATNSNDVYSLGMRNGMRWCKSLIEGVEPKYEGMEGATT